MTIEKEVKRSSCPDCKGRYQLHLSLYEPQLATLQPADKQEDVLLAV